MDHFDAEDDNVGLDGMTMTTSETLEMPVVDDYNVDEMDDYERREEAGEFVNESYYDWNSPAFRNLDAWDQNLPDDEYLGAHYFHEAAERHDIRKGAIFPSKEEAYYNIQKFHILKMAEYKVKKSDTTFMKLVCKQNEGGCPWSIRVICSRDCNYWVISKYAGDHICNTHSVMHSNVHMNKKFVATEITDMIRADLRLSVKTVQEIIRNKYGYRITYQVAWLAIREATEQVFGNWEESFSHLPQLLQQIEDTNRGTFVRWHFYDLSETVRVVNRVFWAFAPAIAAYKHCRPVLSVDGTHLFGRFNGKLLIGVGLDANNMLLPLCFALVESENNSSWSWFMDCVRDGVTKRSGLCVISDRHAGIMNAMTSPEWSPPHAHHRYCVRHLQSNFNTKVSDKFLKAKMGLVANADRRHKCDRHYRELLTMLSDKPNVQRWLEDIPREMWCLSYDNEGRRWGSMTTNASECFNNVLKGARDLPISAMVMYTFEQCNGYFCRRRHMSEGWSDNIAPKICERLRPWVERSQYHTVALYHRQNGRYEVKTARKRARWTVQYGMKECACGKWTAFHFPCSHALAVARHLRSSEEDCVDDYYKKAAYRGTWSYSFIPLGNVHSWRPFKGRYHIPNEGFRRTERGRLPSRRIHGEMDQSQFSQRRHPSQDVGESSGAAQKRTQRCKLCGVTGHNRRSCPNNTQPRTH